MIFDGCNWGRSVFALERNHFKSECPANIFMTKIYTSLRPNHTMLQILIFVFERYWALFLFGFGQFQIISFGIASLSGHNYPMLQCQWANPANMGKYITCITNVINTASENIMEPYVFFMANAVRGGGTIVVKGFHPTGSWAPSQYPKRRLSVRSRKVSKPRDLYLELSDRSET